jgi:hypothetical protein
VPVHALCEPTAETPHAPPLVQVEASVTSQEQPVDPPSAATVQADWEAFSTAHPDPVMLQPLTFAPPSQLQPAAEQAFSPLRPAVAQPPASLTVVQPFAAAPTPTPQWQPTPPPSPMAPQVASLT